MKLILISTIVALTSSALFLNGAELVKDGKSASVIVLSEKPTKSANFAAHELQYHIELVTGVKIPIGNTPTADVGQTNIYVGENRNVPPNGMFTNQEYLMSVKGNEIVLTGRDRQDRGAFDYAKDVVDIWDEIGTCYAVYDFLECLGVRWYLPTKLGTAFTPSKDLSVKDMEIRRKPFFECRYGAYYNFSENLVADTVDTGSPKILNNREKQLWFLRSRLGGKSTQINHSFYSYYRRFPEKAEYFAKGYKGQPPQMCYTNPDFITQVVKDARNYFDGKAVPSVAGLHRAGLDCFPVVPMDNTSWCKCTVCQSKILKESTQGKGFWNNTASNYFFEFVNIVAREVKKTHPDKYIGTLAYNAYSYPPKGFRLEDNIVLGICLSARDIFNPAGVATRKALLDAWEAEYPKMKKNVWLYFCFPSLTGKQQQIRVFPGFFASHVESLFRTYQKANVRSAFIEPSYSAHELTVILMDQLEGYLFWKLAFNENSDGRAVIDEFFSLYYGPAAVPMKKFYELIEERFSNPAYRKSEAGMEKVSWEYLGTEEVMKQLDTSMEQAKKAATAEPWRTRVELFEKGIWNYMEKGRKTYVRRAAQMSGSMMQANIPFVKNQLSGDPAKLDWHKAGLLKIYGGLKAEPLKEKIEVRAAHDGVWLYLSFIHAKIDPTKLLTRNALWQNDEYECYFAKQRALPYQMFGIDANGMSEGEKRLGIQTVPWDLKLKIHDVKKKDFWTLRIALKLSEIVPDGIKQGEMLYFNFIRASNMKVSACWIPTFSGFHAPDRLGELYLAPEE